MTRDENENQMYQILTSPTRRARMLEAIESSIASEPRIADNYRKIATLVATMDDLPEWDWRSAKANDYDEVLAYVKQVVRTRATQWGGDYGLVADIICRKRKLHPIHEMLHRGTLQEEARQLLAGLEELLLE